MVISLRERSAQCACDNIGQYNASHLRTLPPYILNQLHDLLCRRSLSGPAASLAVARLVSWATLRVDWSNFDTISDECLLSLAACRSLQSLSLNAMKGSREAPSAKAMLAVLPHLTALREVQLRRCSQVDDSVIDALTQAAGRKLRVLNLQGCSACTDTSLRCIAQRCRGVSSLNLSGCSITDAGVASLCASPLCRQLTELQINRCRDITDASIRLLVDNCPKLSILTFTNCPMLTAESRVALEGLQARGGFKQLFWTVY